MIDLLNWIVANPKPAGAIWIAFVIGISAILADFPIRKK